MLTPNYIDLWQTMVIDEHRQAEIFTLANKIRAFKVRYDIVAAETNVPWFIIGIIHNRECSLNFRCHLHNGDPLSDRTVHVPAGRPKKGDAPFTWEESALDALRELQLDKITTWSISTMLFQLELYNGFGYRHHGIYSPYLWACTNHYTKGKYTEDGHYDGEATDQQIGCAPLIKYLLSGQSYPTNGQMQKQ
jgi:lysozyme family protein